MKQIIYLGGNKARNYTAPHEETDVIGDCDWKEGDVKTELVDYEIEWNDAEREYYPNGDYMGVTTSTIKGIVPIPKKQEGESAATPPDVEQMAEEVRPEPAIEYMAMNKAYSLLCSEDGKIFYSDAVKALAEMYQAGQSAVQDATQEHDLPTNIPDGDGDWSINQETFTRGEVFKILFTQRAMITNDLKTSCWDDLPETAKNIILNPRKPKI